MPVTIVAGAQWGDEGKGKIVDYLSAESDIVVRCQGGPNAGHTIVNDQGTFALHSLPSGVFTEGVENIIGPGVVIDPVQLASEIASIQEKNIDVDRLLISERAHCILPYHVALDRLDDDSRPAELKIGSTGTGIAPAYADKAGRIGIRLGDLRDPAELRRKLKVTLDRHNLRLRSLEHAGFAVDEILEAVLPAFEMLAPFLGDTAEKLRTAIENNQRILLEGQLGVMRDLDWGAYPFVTSSHPTPAGLAAAAGIPPQYVTRSVGVMKAYTTSVGEGPFPTEIHNSDELRERGAEFGATTGRPRRCGWLDLAAARWACNIAGFTEIALTKLDILASYAEIPVCTSYTRSGQPITAAAASMDWNCDGVYETLSGWQSDIGQARQWEELPENARQYVGFCSEFLGRPITMVGTGREREALIIRPVH